MAAETPNTQENAPLELDAANECLRRGDQRIALTPKAWAVLRYLEERAGRLVTKDELLDALWGDTSVTDGVLKVCVLEIRRALDDDPKAPRYIETLHRRGYRFLAALPRVENAANAAAPAERDAVLVGRDGAFAELDRAFSLARGGRRALALVLGDAGLGKTRLLEAFLDGAPRRERAWILRGACHEHFGAGEAYLPLFEALSDAWRSSSDADRKSLRAALQRCAPTWLAELSTSIQGVDREELLRETLGATRERMLREAAELFESLSRERPLVLALEDLHWSDASTLDLVARLARRREHARLLVVGTLRPVAGLATSHPLRTIALELARHGLAASIELGPLSREDVERFLAARFPGAQLGPQLARDIHARTDGHPMFLAHASEALVERGVLVQHGARFEVAGDVASCARETPESLIKLLEAEFERLAPEDRRALEAASASGADFSTLVAAAALDLDLAAVEERLDALARTRRFLRRSGDAEYEGGVVCARYAFLHGLHQSLLYERIPPAVRTRMHARIAERAEAALGGRAVELASPLAMHFDKGRDPKRALRYYLVAARTDARRFANREAAAHVARALELADALDPKERSKARAELLEEHGRVLRAMGDMRASAQAFETLARERAAAKDKDGEAQALLHACTALFWSDRARCLATVDRALKLADALSDERLSAHVRGWCGHWILNLRGPSDDAFDACAQAVEALRDAADTRLLSLHLVRFAYAQFLRGDYEGARASAEEGGALALASGDAFDWLLSRFLLGWALLHAGDLAAMQQKLDEALAAAEKNGHELWAMLYRLELAQRASALGESEKSIALAQPIVDRVRGASDATGQIFFHGSIALAEALVGSRQLERAAKVLDEVEEALAEPEAFMDWMLWLPLHLVRAELELARDDAGAAKDAAKRLRAHAERSSEPTYLAHAARLETAIRAASRSTSTPSTTAARSRRAESGARAKRPAASPKPRKRG